ncbi:FeoB-associated Cys-rich membrane protein [uncultured Anaerococcus sp.]|uniref:FeoB-associated Cys-rich membrane protein n=1 Tax=uncultured Anaerococcus sp. TaxID=293428 RepID=UPI0026119A81|nr:FeoB-associated Cys-rich membrane protein [uncultured Anaerococcus sp.]
MNLQSIILLLIILAGCAYVVYTRFIAEDGHAGCKDCISCSSSKDKDKHNHKSCGCGC